MRNNLLDDGQTSSGFSSQSSSSSSSYALESGGGGGGFAKHFSTASPPPITRRTFTLLLILVSLMAIVILALAVSVAKEGDESGGGSGGGGGSSNETNLAYIGAGVVQADLWRHLNALQAIADANGGTRAIGHLGFNATVDYIRNVLETETSYDVIVQPFITTAWFQGPPSVNITIGSVTNQWRYQTDYHVLTYSGSVLATAAPLYAVNNYGCNAADYTAVGFTAGGVALMPAGVCTSGAKAAAAASQGGVAVLIYQSRTTRTFLPGGVTEGTSIGAFLLMYETGIALAESVYGRQGAVTVAANLSTSIAPTGVSNVCATTKYGDKTNTIISGSHCDSVPAGPGVSHAPLHDIHSSLIHCRSRFGVVAVSHFVHRNCCCCSLLCVVR